MSSRQSLGASVRDNTRSADSCGPFWANCFDLRCVSLDLLRNEEVQKPERQEENTEVDVGTIDLMGQSSGYSCECAFSE